MKRRVILLSLAIALVSTTSVMALTLVPGLPPSSAWVAHTEETCCGQQVTYYTINTSSYRDFTTAEAIADTAGFKEFYGAHVDVPSPCISTWTFNCHSYALGPTGWVNDPSPWLGASSPCWVVDNTNGIVYRFAGHSAKAGYGQTYVYYAKCGACPMAYHDNVQPYGAHYERWRQR
jgi:hypothetical protein